MQFSELTVRLLLIFFPGIIAALIVDNLTSNRVRDLKIFLLNSFILGLSSYILLYLLIGLNNVIVNLNGFVPTLKVSFLTSLTDGKSIINIREVIVASVLSVMIALLVSATVNHKLLHRFAQKLNITKKFAQSDVWEYVFDSPDVEWVIVRDLNNDLMYQGWVGAFADTHENNELFLRDVIVYRNSTAEELYSMKGIYITMNKDNIIIEFPQIGKPNNN